MTTATISPIKTNEIEPKSFIEVETTNIVKAEKTAPLKLTEALALIGDITTRNENGTFAVAVTTEAQMLDADTVKGIMDKEYKRIWEDMSGPVKAADALHSDLVARRKVATDPYSKLKDAIVAGNKAYLRAEEDKREAARKLAEETARKEAEDKALEEAAALEAEAARLKAEGHAEEAEQMTQEAAQVVNEPIYVAPVMAAPLPKMDARTYGVKYKAQVIDKMALIRYVAQNPGMMELLDVNEGACNRKASSQKEQMNIPGLKLIKV